MRGYRGAQHGVHTGSGPRRPRSLDSQHPFSSSWQSPPARGAPRPTLTLLTLREGYRPVINGGKLDLTLSVICNLPAEGSFVFPINNK